jgi:hypothetical protein
MDKSTLGIYRWNDQREDWDYVGGTNDPVADTITVTVDRLGLYTAAPPMPAGAIALTGQATPSGSGPNAHVTVAYTSTPLAMNTGQPVPDGTLFTVMGVPTGGDAVAIGTVAEADQDPATDGVQVAAHGGVIQFTVDYPFSAGQVSAVAFATGGTAYGQVTTVVPQQ